MFISSLFLDRKSYFRNDLLYFVYKNPNSQQWVCIGSFSDNDENLERVAIGYDYGRLISYFWDCVSIKGVIYLKNNDTIRKLISTGEIAKGEDFTTSF